MEVIPATGGYQFLTDAAYGSELRVKGALDGIVADYETQSIPEGKLYSNKLKGMRCDSSWVVPLCHENLPVTLSASCLLRIA